MEKIDKTLSRFGELLRYRLEAQKRTTRGRFSIPCASEVIEDYYKDEVRLRNRDYKADDKIKEALEKIGRWLEDPNGTLGLMLSGTPGNGKTTAIDAIRNMINNSRLPDPELLDSYGSTTQACLFVYSATDIVSVYSQNPQQFKYLKEVGLLAIDDLGVEPAEAMQYGNIVTPIADLIYERYKTQRLTIVSTNQTVKQVRERYGPRIADRFNEMMTQVFFREGSFRTVKGKPSICAQSNCDKTENQNHKQESHEQ